MADIDTLRQLGQKVVGAFLRAAGRDLAAYDDAPFGEGERSTDLRGLVSPRVGDRRGDVLVTVGAALRAVGLHLVKFGGAHGDVDAAPVAGRGVGAGFAIAEGRGAAHVELVRPPAVVPGLRTVSAELRAEVVASPIVVARSLMAALLAGDVALAAQAPSSVRRRSTATSRRRSRRATFRA